MPRGVKLRDYPGIDEVIKAVNEHQGYVTKAGKALGIDYHAITRVAEKEPRLKKALFEARKNRIETQLDNAEEVLETLMSKVHDEPNCALKSAMYVLNNLGKARGFAHPDDETNKAEDLDKVFKAIGEMAISSVRDNASKKEE